MNARVVDARGRSEEARALLAPVLDNALAFAGGALGDRLLSVQALALKLILEALAARHPLHAVALARAHVAELEARSHALREAARRAGFEALQGLANAEQAQGAPTGCLEASDARAFLRQALS